MLRLRERRRSLYIAPISLPYIRQAHPLRKLAAGRSASKVSDGIGGNDVTRNFFLLAGLVFLAGIFGGLLNALRGGQHKGLTPAPVQMPGAGDNEADKQPAAGWQPGLLLNTLTGGIAAVLSWGLYGPLAESNLLYLGAIPTEINVLTPSALVGAFFIGYGGSRWLSTEADKRILKTSNSVTGDSAATVASGAATTANGAATVASNAADLVEAAAPQDPQLMARATQLRETAEQVSDQAQQLQGQSKQIKEQAQVLNAGQTVQDILNTAQGITESAGEVEKSANAIGGIADKSELQEQ